MAIETVKGFESSYGACYTTVTIWTAKTKHELIKAVKDANWRREGENPGQLYAQYYKALKYYSTDDGFAVIVECSNHYDI